MEIAEDVLVILQKHADQTHIKVALFCLSDLQPRTYSAKRNATCRSNDDAVKLMIERPRAAFVLFESNDFPKVFYFQRIDFCEHVKPQGQL